MKLSYSTLRLLYECPHNYLNKISGVKQPESIFLTEGSEAHLIIQKHVSGVEVRPDLAHINYKFPIVEKIKFDPDTKFTIAIDRQLNILDKTLYCMCEFPKMGAENLCIKCRKPEAPFLFTGFFDGLNMELNDLLEIKTSSSMWSIAKFEKLIQRKIYGWAMPTLKRAILITAPRDPAKWDREPPKVLPVPFTEKDRIEAKQWILGTEDRRSRFYKRPSRRGLYRPTLLLGR